MGGRAEGLACADPGARTPIGASGNYFITVDNDNTKNSITLVVIRYALLVVMVAMNLDNLSFVVYSWTAD